MKLPQHHRSVRAATRLAACLAASLCGPVLAQWQPCVGTAGLNMQSLASRGELAFAGGATGVYRSTDEGFSFQPSNSGNDSTGPTRGFAQDAKHLYTCTSQGVFRSQDDGLTWVPKSQGLANLLGSGILHVEGRLFLVGPAGIWRSLDQAENWTAAGLSGVDVRCIASVGSILFVGTNGSGVYRSDNWGETWAAVNTGLTSSNVRAIEAMDGVLFAGGQVGSGVFRSSDLGANWTRLRGGLPSGSYRGFATDGGVIFAGSFGAGVFYSRDSGAHWFEINAGLANLTVFDLEVQGRTLLAATNTAGVFRFDLSNLVDLDGNGCIGAGDLAILIGSWGACDGCRADLDGDGLVGSADLLGLLAEWSSCP